MLKKVLLNLHGHTHKKQTRLLPALRPPDILLLISAAPARHKPEGLIGVKPLSHLAILGYHANGNPFKAILISGLKSGALAHNCLEILYKQPVAWPGSATPALSN